MIDLTGLNGATILVAPGSIYRLRPTTPSEGRDATRVDYLGGYVLTLEPAAALLGRLTGEVRLIALTTRNGTPVWLNAAAITRVREALPINGPGSEIVVGGAYQHVVETVAAVQALLGA